MRKILFGVFAHPDDEAFGPSATLMREVEAGTELHLVCATAGEGGANPDHCDNLGAVRLEEWRAAGEYIGAHRMYALGYADGHLSHHCYHALADRLEKHIREACSGLADTELCLMTFAANGITGHLDHIAISYITTFVYYRLKAEPPQRVTVKELAYFGLSAEQKPQSDGKYFIYSPPGYPAAFTNRQVDVRPYVAKKYEAMRLHHSQRYDAEHHIGLGETFHATDYFHVV
jgi:LmbE family N-acetylglucosaminyl deacetylase